MAQTLDSRPSIRERDTQERDVTPPAVLPARLEPPTSLLLPRTVAGRQRLNPGWAVPVSGAADRKWRLDWTEIGMIALILACAALAVYRLFWAIQP